MLLGTKAASRMSVVHIQISSAQLTPHPQTTIQPCVCEIIQNALQQLRILNRPLLARWQEQFHTEHSNSLLLEFDGLGLADPPMSEAWASSVVLDCSTRGGAKVEAIKLWLWSTSDCISLSTVAFSSPVDFPSLPGIKWWNHSTPHMAQLVKWCLILCLEKVLMKTMKYRPSSGLGLSLSMVNVAVSSPDSCTFRLRLLLCRSSFHRQLRFSSSKSDSTWNLQMVRS